VYGGKKKKGSARSRWQRGGLKKGTGEGWTGAVEGCSGNDIKRLGKKKLKKKRREEENRSNKKE